MNKENYISNKELREKAFAVFAAINLTYPVGMSKSDEKYFNYIGIKSIINEINNNILDDEVFKSKWENGLLSRLSERIGHKVIGATLGLVPNIGGFIVLEESDDLRLSKAIHFYVSFVFHFYSIQMVSVDKFMEYTFNDMDVVGYGL